MNFDFSDDQKFLKSEARKFLDARCSTAVVRGVLDNAERSYDEALWKGVAEQGWLGVAIPEEHGGLGLGHVELCAIAEELGRAVAPTAAWRWPRNTRSAATPSVASSPATRRSSTSSPTWTS